ncbi:MAG: HAMP domain-containing histidine kinase [Acidobacteria bacterium]|nr:HAMP domain-containing histidine kinase [Acidobacteriota bacterium]
MEALLSPRLKNVIAALLGAVLAAAAAWFGLFPAGSPDPARAQARLTRDCERMESVLARLVQDCLRRSELAAAATAQGRLAAAGLEEKEALVEVRDGIVTSYVGEIYYFKPLDLAVGDWQLIRKNNDVYFQRRVDPRQVYLRFFMDLNSPLLRRTAGFAYPVFNLKFLARPLPGARNEFSYDRALERFFGTRVFQATQGQLVLSIVFSRETLERNSLRRRKMLAYGLLLLLCLTLFLALKRRTGFWLAFRFLAGAGMAAAAWRAIEWAGVRDLYFPRHPGAVRSVFQLLTLLLFLMLAARLALKRVQARNNFLALFVFNLLAAAALTAVDAVLAVVDFPCGDFVVRPSYLGLLALVLGLMAAPLLAAAPFLKPVPLKRCWPLLLLQAALAAAAGWIGLPPLPFCLLTLAFAAMLLTFRRAGLRVLVPMLLLALAASLALGDHSLRVKKGFIQGNLKPIFSSHDDYAKLVAREVVFELNSLNIPFSAFFTASGGSELTGCWKNTLAAREDIASGIYVVASDGGLLHSFSYQIPYIPLDKQDAFPFWHVENVEAELFGRGVRLAVATINVFQGERFLGYITVQVLNTAELVLKSREPQSVLRADRRVVDSGLDYIKLDEAERILENPANINVPGLAALARSGSPWLRFTSTGVPYEGCAFQSAEGVTVVFFPRITFFQSFSEYAKILGFLLLLAALFHLRRLRAYPWRQVFGSFSVKVFAILVLLSMLTAAVFSLFSLNFNVQSQEIQRIQAAHGRGRTALAMVNNLLAAGGEIAQSHLFLLDKVLETGISVYEKGTLLYTSDHRKLIRSQLPVYLSSAVRDRLQRDNQQFELRQSGKRLDLFFWAAGDYVFHMQFPADSAEQLRARRYYFDFMVTIFFVLIALGLAAAFFFRDRILAPIHRLNSGMAAVQRGDLRPLDAIPAEIELRELYQGFNSMLEGIQEQKRSASEIARMKTLVQLGRRVAHEVKNPLTPIRLSAEQIHRSLQDSGGGDREVIAAAVRYIIEETEHLRRVAFGFLNLSKLDELRPEPFRLDDLVGEAVARLRSIYPQVRFSLGGSGPGIGVVADRQKIKQAIDNVLTNALEAVAGRDGEIAVTLGQEDERALVRVSDNGVGISAGELERIAREEFSSKDMGAGLGLVVARRFLELHRGGLEIDSRQGSGTTVVMRFAKHVQPS